MINKIMYFMLPHPGIVYAEGYDLSDKFITNSAGDLTTIVMEFAANAYWLFMLISILYFGYKILGALNVYADRSVHPIQQVQAIHEVLEPAKGLIFLDAGILFIRIAISTIYPDVGSAINTSGMATFLGSILGMTNKDELIKNLISAGMNLGFYIFTITYAIKTAISLIQSFKADSATESEQFRQQAFKNLKMVAVGVFGVLVINLLLDVFGFGGIFKINS